MNAVPLSPTPGAVVLMYHRVAVLKSDVHGLCIAPETFHAHMSELHRHYRPTGLVELADALASGHIPPRSVAVTLDDGCLDNLTTASGILQEFDIPATFFIPTERLDERREYWWDTLERVFFSTEKLPSHLDLSGADVYVTATEEERTSAHRLLAEKIRGLPVDARDEMMNRISTWAGGDMTPRDSHRPMLPEELRELSERRGHAIGAHSVHHLRFPTLAAEQKRREMLESQQTLEALLGAEVTAFAYPYGQFDDETLALAADMFAVAVTVIPRAARMDANPMALPRIDASLISRSELAECLNSIFSRGDLDSR
jgi:peptidoglycan/xylan/chitin deacetylase (PgdA/CDA1 family)